MMFGIITTGIIIDMVVRLFSELYKEGMDRKLGPSDNLDDFLSKSTID